MAMIDASNLSSLVGYTAIAAGTAEGEVDGHEGELIKLDNGMIFELSEFSLLSDYSPDVVVFQRTFSVTELKQLGVKWEEPLVVYKLVIGEELVEVRRLL